MEKIYTRPSYIREGATSGFCPGCMHSTVHKLVGEVLDELGIVNNTVTVWGVGCCILGAGYTTHDSFGSPHGRACAVASAYKRTNPNEIVYTYQGDGDLASIGIAETIYAANRGENFTVIFINNSTYGMTGGQMAPTTLVGQKATTAPFGRDPKQHGYPVHVCELLATLKAPYYLERVTCLDAPNVLKAKKAIKKAFQNQIDGKGFSLVEIMSNCPTNWGMAPLETLEFMKENTLKEFPLGVYRDKDAE
ncbi:MAG: 2-oxoglutarate oxidoreductase [Clostridia bacterium]|nr:2-oxoglutarate oxidoreductase [Clostridia bacterium]